MVRDCSFRNNRRLIGEILAQKRSTHVAQLGTWAVPYSAARTPEGVAEDIGTFQLVEGRVMDSAVVRRRGCVNLGADWKSDFTFSIAPRDRKLFDAEGEDILALKGHIVRVRG